MPKASPTRTRYTALDALRLHDLRRMYQIFSEYYDNVDMETFMYDLGRKSGAFVVRCRAGGQIVGFSTVVFVEFSVDGRRVRGMFSGDTVVEKAFWGSRSLTFAFMGKMFLEALKHPFTRQYWFLISKGYKTYLLLANNFLDYYPRAQGAGDHMRSIVEAYCERLFPGHIDRRTMLLDFGPGYCKLKSGVAQITPEMARNNPNIAHFEKVNPSWRRGTELPCVARCDLWVLLRALPSQIRKSLTSTSRSSRDASVTATPHLEARHERS